MSWDAIADADMIERLTAENARLRGEVEALMSSDMNERPADFRATICRVDGHPCEGQGTDTDCNACTAELRRLQDVERLWCEACEVARTHCPVGIGESHIRQGIPRLAQRIAALTADLARVTGEWDHWREMWTDAMRRIPVACAPPASGEVKP